MTSVTISTTVTYDTGTGDPGEGHYGNYTPHPHCGDDSNDIGYGNNGNRRNSPQDRVANDPNIPEGMKELYRMIFNGSGVQFLPSEVKAMDTMQQFQQKNGIGEISYDQMKQIASGELKQINGVDIPENVKRAAETYVAKNGALFDKVENARTGKHDAVLGSTDPDFVDRSQLSNQPTQVGTSPHSFMNACIKGHISPNEPEQYDAVKTMSKFQKDNDIKLISYDQMKQIASGELTQLNGKTIPDDVKEAAEIYVADEGALFDKIESATTGKHDSQLSAGDGDKAVEKGLVHPGPMSEQNAVDTMEAFQRDGGPKLISYDQMKDIASGKLDEIGGKKITPEVRAAAQTYVANDGALFDKIENATDGKHDSQLGAGDPAEARKKGVQLSNEVPAASNNINLGPNDAIHIHINISGLQNGNGQYSFDVDGPQATEGSSSRNGPMSAADTRAVEDMENFQLENGIGLISYDQMKDIASGKLTQLNGKDIPPEVKSAAQAYVADNGALFDKIEDATDGKHDSQLGAGDPQKARDKGVLGMSDSRAVDTFEQFQKNPMAMMMIGKKPGDLISFDEMKEIAETGRLNGREVPSELRQAAKVYVADNGALFDKIEAAKTGSHDSQLGSEDPQAARDKGLIDR